MRRWPRRAPARVRAAAGAAGRHPEPRHGDSVGQLVGALGCGHRIDSGGMATRSTCARAASRLDTGRLQREVEEHGSLEDLFDVYARVARRFASEPALLPAQDARAAAPLAAFEDYVKGLLADTPGRRRVPREGASRCIRATTMRGSRSGGASDRRGAARESARGCAVGTPHSRRVAAARFAAASRKWRSRGYDDAFDALRMLGEELAVCRGCEQHRRDSAAARRLDAERDAPRTGSRGDAGTPEPDYYFNLGYCALVRTGYPGCDLLVAEASPQPCRRRCAWCSGRRCRCPGSAAEAARELELADGGCRHDTRARDEGRANASRAASSACVPASNRPEYWASRRRSWRRDSGKRARWRPFTSTAPGGSS